MSPVLIIILAIVGVVIIFFAIMIINVKKKLTNYDFSNDSQKIIILNDKTFYYRISKGLALVDFWAEWCQPCKMQAPIINELAEEMSEQIKVCKLNVDKNKIIAGKLNVRNIPTIILFKNGKEVERFVGTKTKNVLKKALSKYLTV